MGDKVLIHIYLLFVIILASFHPFSIRKYNPKYTILFTVMARDTEAKDLHLDLELCGKDFYIGNMNVSDININNNNNNNSTIEDTGDEVSGNQIYTMSVIYLVFSLLSSLIILVFVDPLDR